MAHLNWELLNNANETIPQGHGVHRKTSYFLMWIVIWTTYILTKLRLVMITLNKTHLRKLNVSKPKIQEFWTYNWMGFYTNSHSFLVCLWPKGLLVTCKIWGCYFMNMWVWAVNMWTWTSEPKGIFSGISCWYQWNIIDI